MTVFKINAAPLTREDCYEWAGMGYWDFGDGILLSMGLNPNKGISDPSDDLLTKIGNQFQIRMKKISRCQNATDRSQRPPQRFLPYYLDPNYHPEDGPRDDGEGYWVFDPAPFTKWAIKYMQPFPDELMQAVRETYPEEFCEAVRDVEATPQKPETEPKEKTLRNNQRHRERCRALASLIWSKEPNITIADMSLRDEIVTFGCEGTMYSEDTLRDWLKDLCPNRSPGRRADK